MVRNNENTIEEKCFHANSYKNTNQIKNISKIFLTIFISTYLNSIRLLCIFPDYVT